MAVTRLKEAGLIPGDYLGDNNQNSGAIMVPTPIMMVNLGDDT